MYEENVNLDTLFYDYSNFVRCKNTMQDKIGSALEYLSEELTFHAKELSSEQQEKLQEVSDKLEAIYNGLDAVIAW